MCIFVQTELAPHDIMYIEICAYTIFYCQFHVVKVDIMSRGYVPVFYYFPPILINKRNWGIASCISYLSSISLEETKTDIMDSDNCFLRVNS